MPDVWVTFGDGIPSIRTDASGNYSLKVADGTYTVGVSNESWSLWPQSQSVTVAGADLSSVNFQAEAFRVRVPYTEGFEDGRSGPAWTLANTTSGRVGILDCSHDGNYALAFDHVWGGTYEIASASLSVDLACRTDAQLSFWWLDHGDEDHNSAASQ